MCGGGICDRGLRQCGGRCRLLDKAGDSEALAAAIVNLLAHPAERDRVAAQGLARVGRFDRAVVLAGYLDAYEAALAGR